MFNQPLDRNFNEKRSNRRVRIIFRMIFIPGPNLLSTALRDYIITVVVGPLFTRCFLENVDGKNITFKKIATKKR